MENHLFIVWEKASYELSNIINDIKKNLTIRQIIECTWEKKFVPQNFSRFYGTNLPKNSKKEQECGSGKFHIILVQDNSPKYEYRETSKGKKIVNTNIFDRKEKYRKWTGGGSKIHGTNNRFEFNHDITLLLGLNEEDYFEKYGSKPHRIIQQDIIGHNGWSSLKQVFYVLNNTCNYVIMRGSEHLTQEDTLKDHLDIDILTSCYADAAFIINGVPSCSIHRPHQAIKINNKIIYLDLWDSCRQYFDPCWSNEMLKTRILENGVFVLNQENHFYCLLYHCLINKNKIATDYLPTLQAFKEELKISEFEWNEILVNFLKKKKYDIIKSDDQSIGFHIEDPIVNEYSKRKGKPVKTHYFYDLNLYSKTFEQSNSYLKQASSEITNNEYAFLKKLENYSFFPKIITKSDDSILITKIPGKSLKELTTDNKHLSIIQQRNLLIQTINILEILYTEKIIHRDFTPENILINIEDKNIQVFLIDFGWAVKYDKKETLLNPFGLGSRYRYHPYYSDAYALAQVLKEIFPNSTYLKKASVLLENIAVTEIPSTDNLKEIKKFVIKNNFIYLGTHQIFEYSFTLKSVLHNHWKKIIFQLHFKKWTYSCLSFFKKKLKKTT